MYIFSIPTSGYAPFPSSTSVSFEEPPLQPSPCSALEQQLHILAAAGSCCPVHHHRAYRSSTCINNFFSIALQRVRSKCWNTYRLDEQLVLLAKDTDSKDARQGGGGAPGSSRLLSEALASPQPAGCVDPSSSRGEVPALLQNVHTFDN